MKSFIIFPYYPDFGPCLAVDGSMVFFLSLWVSGTPYRRTSAPLSFLSVFSSLIGDSFGLSTWLLVGHLLNELSGLSCPRDHS